MIQTTHTFDLGTLSDALYSRGARLGFGVASGFLVVLSADLCWLFVQQYETGGPAGVDWIAAIITSLFLGLIDFMLLYALLVKSARGPSSLTVSDRGLVFVMRSGRSKTLPWTTRGRLVRIVDGRANPHHALSGVFMNGRLLPRAMLTSEALDAILEAADIKGLRVERTQVTQPKSGDVWQIDVLS